MEGEVGKSGQHLPVPEDSTDDLVVCSHDYLKGGIFPPLRPLRSDSLHPPRGTLQPRSDRQASLGVQLHVLMEEM